MLRLRTAHAIMQSRLIATNPWGSEDLIASGRVPLPPGSNICAHISLLQFHRETSTQRNHKPTKKKKKKRYVYYTVPELGVGFCNGLTIKTKTRTTSLYCATPVIGQSTLLTFCDRTLCHSTYLNVMPITKWKGNGFVLLTLFLYLRLSVYSGNGKRLARVTRGRSGGVATRGAVVPQRACSGSAGHIPFS